MKSVLKKPEQLGSVFYRTLQAVADAVPEGLTAFLILWLPLLLGGLGAVAGFLLTSRGISFVLGLAGAALTRHIFKSQQAVNDPVKISQASIVWTFIPLLMLDATGWFLPLFMMIATSSAPTVLASLPTPPKFSDSMAALSLTVAAVIVFGVSSGGSGIVNDILLGALFAGAGYIVPLIPADVLKKASDVPQLNEFVFSHAGLAHVLLQTIIAKIFLYFLYGLILPDFLFETQNNMFTDLILTAIGLGVLVGGFFIRGPKSKSEYLTYFTAGVLVSYIMIILILVLQELTLVTA